MKCNQCEKEFETKSKTARFCSGKCRLIFFRKNKKESKGLSTEAKINILYNNFIEAIAEFKELPKTFTATPSILDAPKSSAIIHDEPAIFHEPKRTLVRSFETYAQMRKECETEDDWQYLKQEILSAQNLTSKQKTLLTT